MLWADSILFRNVAQLLQFWKVGWKRLIPLLLGLRRRFGLNFIQDLLGFSLCFLPSLLKLLLRVERKPRTTTRRDMLLSLLVHSSNHRCQLLVFSLEPIELRFELLILFLQQLNCCERRFDSEF